MPAVAYQRDLYTAVKSHGSTRHVPVLVFSRGDPFIYNAEIGDISAYLDYGNMHSYSGGQEPTGSTNSLADYISVERIICGTKPLMATETGYYTAPTASDTWQPGVSELAQGKYIPRIYLEYFLAGVRNTWIYEFIDEGTDQTKSEQNYGLLRNDGSPKPSFVVMKNLITLLKDTAARFRPGSIDVTLAGQVATVNSALLQKSTGEFYLIAWLAVSSFDTSTQQDIETVKQIRITLREPVRLATAYQPEESTEPVAQYRHPQEITLDVADRPIVLRLVKG